MMRKRNAGFTLLEVTAAAALAALLVAMLYTPLVNGIIMVNRENTEMNMFRAADSMMTRLSSVLQSAVLPVPPGPVVRTPADATSFYEIARSREQGFGNNGEAWAEVLQEGTDFLPFCTPVAFGGTESAVDSSGLPVLGVVMPGGAVAASQAAYVWSEPAPGERKFVLSGNIHPALSAVPPSAFGIAPAPAAIDPAGARYAERLAFPGASPGTAAQGYSVVRFVPARENGMIALADETVLGYDLNQDGDREDSFARGALVIDYANGGDAPAGETQSRFPLSGQSVLLQLNTDDGGRAPLFRLVGGFNGGNSPAGKTWDAENSPGSFTLLVRLLLFDQETQRGTPLATGPHGGRRHITRWCQSFIELRNMSIE